MNSTEGSYGASHGSYEASGLSAASSVRRFGQRLDGFEGAMRAMVQESIQVQGNFVFEAVESVKKDMRAFLQEQ